MSRPVTYTLQRMTYSATDTKKPQQFAMALGYH